MTESPGSTRGGSGSIVPCIWLDDQAEEAASFYLDTFRDGSISSVSHYPESFDNPGGKPRGSVLTVDFEVLGQRFTLLNGGPMFVPNPSLSFFVHTRSAEETDRLFAVLAEDGQVMMSLDAYPWSERYAFLEDRFGVSWQLILGLRRDRSSIAPCMMFSDAQHGKAEEAIELYTGTFPDSHIEALERYTAAEGPEGTVKHSRFTLDGQDMVAMDSHVTHGITFTEALSLQVTCADQKEVDRYWETLAQGGEHGPCGWLKDRFGFSWQIVPESISEYLASQDVAARDRAFQAMLGMQKFDIAALQAAFEEE